MQKEIKHTWQFAQSPKEVWEYLTKPELIEQWLMKTDFKPEAGYKFSFTFDPKPGSTYDGIVNCEVLEVTPFTTLCYSWNGSSNNGSRTFHSKVRWTLLPGAGGTELQLQHDGFEMVEDMLAHSNGWNACVARFETLINTEK